MIASPTIGFTLEEKRHGHDDPQRLGFWWFAQDGTHNGIEMAIPDRHPMIVAKQLSQMAEAIRRKHWGA